MKIISILKDDITVIENEDFEDEPLLGLLYFFFGKKLTPYLPLLKL